MSETVTTARRWNSFVCPGCRCVFRVPQDHDGTGVVCPACRIMMRLPGPGDELPPLVALAPAVAEPVEIEEYEDDDNEDADEAAAAARSDRTFVAVLVVSAVILVGLSAWWLMPEKKAAVPMADVPSPPVLSTTDGAKTGSEASISSARSPLQQIESTVKAFLEAPTREAALAMVADPDDSARKWDGWLAGETYVAPGFQGMVGEPVTTGAGEGATSVVFLRTSDYILRELHLINQGGSLKVDWDSWVGWSEMTWKDFREKKPTEPVLFRVNLSEVPYFNFDFSDDNAWASFRLDSQDGIESLYGYVPRAGDMDQLLTPTDAGTNTRWVLKLKYPPGAARDNQVLIDSVVNEGWLMKKKETE